LIWAAKQVQLNYNFSLQTSRVLAMRKLFYKLGKIAGPSVRKAKWFWQTATNSQAEAIKAEYEVGRDMACDVRRRLGPDPDRRTGEILAEVGSRLAGCVADKFRSFSFESVTSPAPEAFCLPGGFIFVSRAIMELCRADKDEIAFILAHEMAHVVRGHVMERMISNSAIAAASRAAPIRDVLSACLREAGAKFLESAYSQDQELEADKLGVHLVTAAGYDPRGSVRFFSRLAKSHEGRTSTASDQSNLGNYFSSHPSGKVRIENITDILSK
jgi:predicted Zn-dependent protease